MTNFSALGLAETLLRALAQEGYETPTPIQTQAIPPLLAGRDLLGIAQTGTGKTAAFALPILQRLSQSNQRPSARCCRALILAPTRELAAQIADSFQRYGKNLRLSIALIVGGVSYSPQIRAMARGVDVLVATPGRLIDHLENQVVRLDKTEIVVLDEADHMLDLGFLVPVRRLLKEFPPVRQSLFFSATMPREMKQLADDMLKDPVEVTVSPVSAMAERIEQRVYLIEQSRKRDLLIDILRDPNCTRGLVFTRTKRGADRVTTFLEAAGIAAVAIHGEKTQGQRERAMAGFKQGRCNVLVATDIAARGIDVDGISHVVNYEMPQVAECYVHRIGRTARAGAAGIAVSLVDIEERGMLRDIEKLTRQKLPTEDLRELRTPEPSRFSQPRQPARQGQPARRDGPRPANVSVAGYPPKRRSQRPGPRVSASA